MRSPRTIATTSLGVFACALLLAGPARAADTFYTEPNGSGSTCSSGTPCQVTTALGMAGSGDTVVMAGNKGTYFMASAGATVDLHIPDGVVLTGAPGQPIPIWYSASSDGTAVTMDGANSRLANLDIEYSYSPGQALQAWGTVDRVIARGTGTIGDGCLFRGGTTVMTNSICAGMSAGSNGVFEFPGFGTWDIVLRNDLIYGGGDALYGGGNSATVTYTVTNTIFHSVNGDDINIQDQDGSSSTPVSVTADHSNYSKVTAANGATVTPSNTAGNQSAAPLFVNAAGGNFREAAGSPTINAGADSLLNGLLDLAGLSRKIGAHTDIGPYERVLRPTLTVRRHSGITTRAVTINATVNPNGAVTSYRVRYGKTATLGSLSPVHQLAAGTAAKPVSLRLSGLKPGTAYHYRVVATNSTGTTLGPDRRFTTIPNTKLTKREISSTSGKATFRFKAVGHAGGFECALKPKVAKVATFKPCTSPKTYKNLASGNYVFAVRAVGRSGHDPTPARNSFTIQ